MKTPEYGPATSGPSPKNNNTKNVLIGFLSLAVIALFVFLMIDKNNPNDNIQANQTAYQEPINSPTAEEEISLRKSFDESLARIDSLNTMNESLNAELTTKNKEIESAKAEIRRILNNKNATVAELKKAKTMIESLNATIATMEEEVAKLTQEKETLTQEKEVVVQQNTKLTEDLTASTEMNQQLTEKVDVASTLNASNIKITPVKVKNDKEKITYTAKKVDKMMISFDVSNRIAETGTKDVYVTVTGPDGKLITAEQLGSGTFTTRESGDVMFTTKVPVDFETTQRKKVEFYFQPGSDFVEGDYQVKIYQNGFLIGESVSVLKKGGLFG